MIHHLFIQKNRAINTNNSFTEQSITNKLNKIKINPSNPKNMHNFTLDTTIISETDQNPQIIIDNSTKFHRPDYKTPQRHTLNTSSISDPSSATEHLATVPNAQSPSLLTITTENTLQSAIQSAFTSSNPSNYLDLDNPDKYSFSIKFGLIKI